MDLRLVFANTGKTFSYFPNFVKRFDISVNACVFLCYIGWKTMPDSIDDWIPLSVKQITEATGLTEKEQLNARKVLVDKGIIEEFYARLEHILKFRLSSNEIEEIGVSPSDKRADAPPEHQPKGRMAIRQNGGSSNRELNSNKEEGKETLFSIDSESFPTELNTPEFKEAWDTWIKYLKQRRIPLTPLSKKSQLPNCGPLVPDWP